MARRARQTITQRIALTGGEEIRRELSQLGAVGEEAFKRLQDSATRLRGPGTEFEQSIRQAEQSMRRLANGMQTVGRNLVGVGRTFSTFVSGPITAVGAAATLAFQNFQDSMSNVATLVDTNVESMRDMEDAVLAVGRRTPVAVDELTAALFDIRSAGISASDAMRVLEGSAQLAVAGLGSTEQAADLATSAINAFGLEGAEVNNLFNLIFQATQKGKTTIAELSQGFGGVASVIANANVAIDEYLASIAALTTTGAPAAQAHTQMRAAVLSLERAISPELQDAFDTLNVDTFQELLRQSDNVVDAFNKVRGAVEANGDRLVDAITETEAYNAILALTGEQGVAFRETLALMRGGVESLGDAFAKQLGDTTNQLKLLRNDLFAAAVTIGRDLDPAISGTIQLLRDLVAAFLDLGPGARQAVNVIAGILAGLGPVLVGLGLALQVIAFAFGPFITAFKVLAPLLAKSKTLMALLGVAARALGAIAALSSSTWAAFGAGLLVVFRTINAFNAGSATDRLRDGLDRVGQALEDVKNKVPGSVQNFERITEAEYALAVATAEATLELIKQRRAMIEQIRQTPVGQAAIAQGTFDEQFGVADVEKELADQFAVIDGLNQKMAEFDALTGKVANTAKTVTEAMQQTGAAAENVVRVVRLGAQETEVATHNLSRGLQDAVVNIQTFKRATDDSKSATDESNESTRQLIDGLRTLPAATQEVAAASGEAAQAVDQVASATVSAGSEGQAALRAFQNEAQQLRREFDGLSTDSFELPDINAERAINDAAAQLRDFAQNTETEFGNTAVTVGNLFDSMAARIRRVLAGLRREIANIRAGAAATTPSLSGFAFGGPVMGPGTARSDSIAAMLSRGEYVIQAPAVDALRQTFGGGIMDALNRFHVNDLIDAPRFAFGGPVGDNGGSPSAVVNLSLDGESFALSAAGDEANRVLRFAQSKAIRSISRRAPRWR